MWLRDNTALTYNDLTALLNFATAFKNNPLIKATIGRNISTVPPYCFSSCHALTEVIISEEGGTLYLDFGAFYLCGIELITLPTRVTHIGVGSFYTSSYITVIVKAVVPPRLEGDAFNQVKRIYVPVDSVDA